MARFRRIHRNAASSACCSRTVAMNFILLVGRLRPGLTIVGPDRHFGPDRPQDVFGRVEPGEALPFPEFQLLLPLWFQLHLLDRTLGQPEDALIVGEVELLAVPCRAV